MPFTLAYCFKRTIFVASSTGLVISFLNDFPSSIGNLFPGLEVFERLDPRNHYHWKFRPLHYGGKSLAIEFASRFETQTKEIKIYPDQNPSMPQLSGGWKVRDSGSGSVIDLFFDLQIIVPFPALSKAILAPLASQELDKLFVEYAQRLTTDLQKLS